MKEETNKLQQSNVWMQLDDESLSNIDVSEGNLPEDVQFMLKQTAMRTILHQISHNYREELENLLGKDNIDENGQPHALQESTIPFELYEFICKNIIGMVPNIEIEITNEETEESIEIIDYPESNEGDSNGGE